MKMTVVVEQEIEIDDELIKEVIEEGDPEPLAERTLEDWIYEAFGDAHCDGLPYELKNVPELVEQLKKALNQI